MTFTDELIGLLLLLLLFLLILLLIILLILLLIILLILLLYSFSLVWCDSLCFPSQILLYTNILLLQRELLSS